ncbi:MAG: TIGR03084 family metal-binding protein [Actinomycetota bacterium]|nr:TIGR03084 family metal-binding protein [Actinomycetota bacterium]
MESETASRSQALAAELRAETEELLEVLENVGADDFEIPTPAQGWNVADQVAHLAYFDRVAARAIKDPGGFADWLAGVAVDPTILEKGQGEVASLAPRLLLKEFAAAREEYLGAALSHPGERVAWFGPAMSAESMTTARLMETFAHGVDIRDALGEQVFFSERHLNVVYLGYRTIGFSFRNRGLEPPAGDIQIDVRMPDGALRTFGQASLDAAGEENRVTGSLGELALLVVQRRNAADLELVVSGEDARRWVGIAQAFAGPPGPGRPPRSK